VYQFLIPLFLGFTFTSASVFTTYYSRLFGERGGRLVSIILRVVLGIPVWVIGYILAAGVDSGLLFNPTTITSALAWISIVAGVTIVVTSWLTIRWRAAAPSVRDTLVEQGIYAYIRHPIYSATILEMVGSPYDRRSVTVRLWVTGHVARPLEEIDW
jgi:protein-S-isoprenylcysteine O-methyltransferase Ste14